MTTIGLLLMASQALGTEQLQQIRAYEIPRANRRMAEYSSPGAPLSVIRSDVRTLQARQGSTMTVYCGVIQTRAEGRVSQSRFYWVIDVNPANNFLADYERGTWSIINETAADAEEQKLCVGATEGLDDIQMLRSAASRSTGSTLRPFVNDTGRADRRWLIGGWVAGSGCATDTGLHLDADGSFIWGLDSGRWNLDEPVLTLQVTERESEEGQTRYFDPPRLQRLQVNRLELDRLRVQHADGSIEEMVRC